MWRGVRIFEYRGYCSVSSAAELIVDALDGREVVISGQRRDTTVTVNTYEIDGGVVTQTSSVTQPSVLFSGMPPTIPEAL